MSRARTTFILGLLAPLLPLALVGCSDDPRPKVAPEPTESAPTTPAGQHDPRSPVATVKAWVEAQNHALHTGSTNAMEDLVTPNCQSCADFSDAIRTVYDRGGNFKTAGWTLKGIKARDVSSRPVVVDVAVDIAGGQTTRRAGSEPVVYKDEKHIMLFKVDRAHGRWAVSFIGFIS